MIIDPANPLTNYKLLDNIISEFAGILKIQQEQETLEEMWMPYMKDLDMMYTDTTCYESEMRYPTDTKLLWEGIEKVYVTMCERSSRLGSHRPRTKFIDAQKANLAYKKQRKYKKSQTRKMTRRLLEILGKILKETREVEKNNGNTGGLLTVERRANLTSLQRCTISRRTTSRTRTSGKASQTES